MLLDRESQLTGNSYYEQSVLRPPVSCPLQGHLEADVCIIGAGYAGLSAALALREKGYAVTVLEAQKVGWGASGRNGGQVLTGFAGEEAIEQQLSAADARRAWNISMDGVAQVRRQIARHGIACDFVPGYLTVADSAAKAAKLALWVEHVAATYDVALQSIDAADVPAWIASARYAGAAYDPLSGHLHPLKYCLGLAAAAKQAGVRIYEYSPVLDVVRTDKPLVKTALGQVSCRFVVMAGNVYLNQYGKSVAPELVPRIMPVGTYIIATEPMAKSRADALIRARAAVCDTNFILDYFRLTADHRMLFGGRVSYTTQTPGNLTQKMRKRMLSVFPQLADLAIDHTWGGFVDISMNRAPDFGRLEPHIYYLQGFSGHGVALSGMAGTMVAEAIAGQAERFDVLARLRHRDFPGGNAMRMPALWLGTLYYRLRDYL